MREKPETDNNETHSVVLKITFRGDAASELFRRKIQRTVNRNCVNTRVVTIFTSQPLFTTQAKDRLPDMTKSNVIYQFTCNTCKLQYVGRTERRLEDRVREHTRLNPSLKAVKSSIAEHLINTGHSYQRDECFTILHQTHNRRLLKIIEAIYISKLKPKLNVQVEHDFKLAILT